METIKLTDIECIDNRKMEGIEDLAANIAAVGLIQPIALATTETGWSVVAGRRRFRALQQLGRESLNPNEYVLCNAHPGLAAFCENFHRANLTLAEEVEQFNDLNHGCTVRELAALLGKTPEYVALRLNLANLSGKWKEVLNSPEEYPQWTPAKLEMIAKQPPSVQKEQEAIIEYAFTMKGLSGKLEGGYCELKDVAFDTAECSGCSRRSGAADLLFPELSEKSDMCLDKECFEKKLLKHILAEVSAIQKRLKEDPDAEPFYLFYESSPCYGTAARKALSDVDYENYFTREKKGKKADNAYCVWGKGAGTYCRVKPKGSWTKPINPKPDATGATPSGDVVKTGKTLADREQELKAKRDKVAIEELRAFIEDETFFDCLVTSFGDELNEHMLRLALTFGYHNYFGGREKTYFSELPQSLSEDHFLAKSLWRSLKHTFTGKLREAVDNKTLKEISDSNAVMICEFLRLDWARDYFAAAVEEIPEPKALLKAREEEAGK